MGAMISVLVGYCRVIWPFPQSMMIIDRERLNKYFMDSLLSAENNKLFRISKPFSCKIAVLWVLKFF